MASISIEHAIEDKCVTLLQADTYITTNSVPVRRWGDGSSDAGERQAIVRVSELESLNIGVTSGGTYWKCKLEYCAYVPIASDKNMAKLDALYEALLGSLSVLAAASINPAGVVVDGKLNGASSDDFQERHRARSAAAQLFLHTVAIPTT